MQCQRLLETAEKPLIPTTRPGAAIRIWHSWHTKARLVAAVPVLIASLAGNAAAQECACPTNAEVLPENGAVGVPRNTLVWLSAETMVGIGDPNGQVPLDDVIHATTLLRKLDGAQVAYDVTHLGGHAVLHPVQLLEPGQYVVNTPHIYSTFVVDDHVDYEASPPPSLAVNTQSGQGGAGGEGGFGGQPAESSAPWTPNCGPGATPLFIQSDDPILLATVDGYGWPATSVQSGDIAASYFVSRDPQLVPINSDWPGTSCFIGFSTNAAAHAGSYDLAGNFSGWTDTPVVVTVNAPGSGGAFGDEVIGSGGSGGTPCYSGGPSCEGVPTFGTGGKYLYDDQGILGPAEASGCACSAASTGSQELPFAGAALVLGLFLARHAMRVARRAP